MPKREGSVDMNPLAQELGERLRERSLTISVAESCTAGGLAHEITRVPGASTYFLGGVIAYDNAVKTGLLGVPESILVRFGAVSAEVAEAMASSCRSLFETDIAVSITGIAGPGGGTREKPPGLVFVAVADASIARSRRFDFNGSRDKVRSQATEAALMMASSFLADR